MNICIFASDLAIITGHNKFKTENEIILKLWQKNFPEDYNEIISKLNKNEEFDINIIEETSDDYIKRITDKYNIKDIDENINECKNSENILSLNNSKNKIFKSLNNIPKNEKKILKDCLISKVNTNFGIKNENMGLQKYIELSNESVKLFEKFVKKNIFKTSRFNWYIGGRIDGINESETTVIEIKNRVHKLFYTLRDYEKVQIYAYMFILNKKKSKLVECFKKKNDCDINVIEVDFDIHFWEKEVNKKIEIFIKKFQKFLKNDTLKKNLLLSQIS